MRRSSGTPAAGTRARTRRSSEAARAALLEAAATLFARDGYAGASTKEIAHLARTSETTIYRQFGSKSELFTAAVVEPFLEFVDDYAAAFQREVERGGGNYAVLEACVVELYDHLTDRRDAVLALISGSRDPSAAISIRSVTNRLNDMFDRIYSLSLEQWRREGGYEMVHARLWMRLITGLMISVTALEPLLLPDSWEKPSRIELLGVVTDVLAYGMLGSGPDRG
jgi:AcrR family transcriptional regulator